MCRGKVRHGCSGDIAPMMQNQTEHTMGNEMETGIMIGIDATYPA